LRITPHSLEYKKFWGAEILPWKNYGDKFILLIRSSQPQFRGKRGPEAWQLEIILTDRETKKDKKIDIPDINTEADIVLFIRKLRTIAHAEPVGTRKIEQKLITGKNQRINFIIERKSVKEAQIEQSKGLFKRKQK
jgi:hypothetical protein